MRSIFQSTSLENFVREPFSSIGQPVSLSSEGNLMRERNAVETQ